jgi:Bacteriophage HK97-gp10, putative tail-component
VASIDDLTQEIAKQLEQYTEHVEEALEDAKEVVSKELVKDLKRNSPKATGSYAKGWTVKKFRTGNVVHNKTDYQLTHLLEHGHAKVGGGRVEGTPHIRPAEEKAVKEFVERVEEAIKQ